jgi:hypothetical protein
MISTKSFLRGFLRQLGSTSERNEENALVESESSDLTHPAGGKNGESVHRPHFIRSFESRGRREKNELSSTRSPRVVTGGIPDLGLSVGVAFD